MTRALLLLTAVLLTGCAQVESATDSAGDAAARVQDCAGLARDVASIGLRGVPAPAEAEAAARRLAERAEQADSEQVREAAGDLRARLLELAETARGNDAAAIRTAAEQVRDAARAAAETCSVPLDTFVR